MLTNSLPRIEVMTPGGWRKEFQLEGPVAYIGADPSCQVSLDSIFGAGVAGLHAQLILWPFSTTSARNNGHNSTEGETCRLINLADGLIRLDTGQVLSERQLAILSEGSSFSLGEFRLTFRAWPRPRAALQENSAYIGLELGLPGTSLADGQMLRGAVRVTNHGDRDGVQVHLECELNGFPVDCFELHESGLNIDSGAEAIVPFTLHHRLTRPVAGFYPLGIRATAPRDYPGECTGTSALIEVLPHCEHAFVLGQPTALSRRRKNAAPSASQPT